MSTKYKKRTLEQWLATYKFTPEHRRRKDVPLPLVGKDGFLVLKWGWPAIKVICKYCGKECLTLRSRPRYFCNRSCARRGGKSLKTHGLSHQGTGTTKIYAASIYRKHKHKWRARGAVKDAIKSGRLVRLPCEVCGNPNSQGHHEDYSKPLDVIWLCQKHHVELHQKRGDLQNKTPVPIIT